jgi:hypothetical protein
MDQRDFNYKKYFFSTHALKSMISRVIKPEDVKQVIESGETIASYPSDKPYSSSLLLKFVENRPLHVVVAYNDLDQSCIIITCYEPDPSLWDTDFKNKILKRLKA